MLNFILKVISLALSVVFSVLALLVSLFSLITSIESITLSKITHDENLPRVRALLGVIDPKVNFKKTSDGIDFAYDFNFKNFGQTTAYSIEFDLFGVDISKGTSTPVFVDERVRNKAFPGTMLSYKFSSILTFDTLKSIGAVQIQEQSGKIVGYDIPTENAKIAFIFLVRYCDFATKEYVHEEIFYSYVPGDSELSSLLWKDQLMIDEKFLSFIGTRQADYTCK